MRLRVGRLIIIGKSNLKFKGRLLMLPNHQIEKDAVLVTAIFGRMHFRFLMAINQTKLRAPLLRGSVVSPCTMTATRLPLCAPP